MTIQGALPPQPNVVRIDYKFATGGVVFGGLRLFFKIGTGTTSGPTLNALAQSVATSWALDMASLTSSSVSLVQVRCVDLTSDTSPIGVDNTSHPGTRLGDENPIEVCAMVNHHIARRYRGGKPRTYWPAGVALDILQGKTWDPTFVSQFGVGHTNHIAGVKGGAAGLTFSDHVNVSYYSGSTPNTTGSKWDPEEVPKHRPSAQLPDPILSSVINAIPGTQKRRLRSPA